MSCLAAGTLLVLAGAAAGCGNQYRPVINPIQPTGPASQPTAYAVVFSQPTQLTSGAALPGVSSAVPCPTGGGTSGKGGYANPGIVSVVDFSGDNIMAQANVGFGPLTFALDGGGSTAYSTNCDGTLSTVPVSTQLQSKNVGSTTLLQNPASTPTNILIGTTFDYVAQQGRDSVGALTGSPLALKQEIPVAPSLVTVTGTYGGSRVYAISQGNSGPGSQPAWGDCDTPSSVTTNGEADAIEVSTNTLSNRIPVGVCPVYGIATPDDRRTFILNRGSGTITVIDSQKNLLDTQTLSNYLKNATIPVGGGPVYADLYAQAALLVTANYDSNTVSIIDVSLDVYGNDSPNFGHVLATVPVGSHPTAVTILQDGSRAYVANQGDGTVSVVNLSSFTVEKTIAIGGSPTPQPRAIASSYNAPIGKVYVVSPNSSQMTVIRTDNDTISGTVQLQGNGVDVHTTSQFAGASGRATNNNTQSRSAGSGAP